MALKFVHEFAHCLFFILTCVSSVKKLFPGGACLKEKRVNYMYSRSRVSQSSIAASMLDHIEVYIIESKRPSYSLATGG